MQSPSLHFKICFPLHDIQVWVFYHKSDIDTCCWNNISDHHQVFILCSIAWNECFSNSRSADAQTFVGFHIFYTSLLVWTSFIQNSGHLGLAWHSWSDSAPLAGCRISWFALSRAIFMGVFDPAILGFYERKKWCITGAKKRCCVWVGEIQGSVWKISLSSLGLADSSPSHHPVNSCSYISSP